MSKLSFFHLNNQPVATAVLVLVLILGPIGGNYR